MTAKLTYFERRAQQFGFDPDKHFAFYQPNPDEPFSQKVKHPLIWPDKDNNLCYGYVGLDGQLITYDASPAKSKVDIQPVHWKRLAKPRGDQKNMPCRRKIGLFPWISPATAEAFLAKKKIKRLIITEGPGKGLKAYIDGLNHVIAIPSITIWKLKEEHRVFTQISEVIKQCSVEEVVWLTDGDTLQLKYEPRKDLYKRPNTFYVSVRLFKEMMRELDVTLFYAHIREDQPKGLDDILIEKPDSKEQLRKELFHVPENRELIEFMDVTSWSYHRIRSYFGIADDVNVFYAMYEQYIGLEEFVYKQGLYRYDDEAGDVEYLKQGEAARFERIRNTYFIQGTKPTKRDKLENVLIPIKPDEIKHMYKDKTDAQIKSILKDIDYYNGAINRPAHQNYQKSFETHDQNGNVLRWFNVYKKVLHEPYEGECPKSMKFLKHIFGQEDIAVGEKVVKSYELGLDYLQLLWTRPQQMLPILCLVSEHRHTGKTTFWNWMRAIFQQNARFVRVDQLTGQFTSFFANALLVVVDEALIEKRTTMERVKALVTADTFTMEAKHQDAEEVDSFVKVGISSNNIHNFAQIDKDEVRFWVREIHPIPEEEQNLNLLVDLEQEIPALLHLLENRKMITENQTRAWFANELIRTEALERVMDQSKSGVEQVISNAIHSHMMEVNQASLKLSMQDLKRLIGENELRASQIGWALLHRMGKHKSKHPVTYNLYRSTTDAITGEFKVDPVKERRVVYSFYATDFCKAKELFDGAFSIEALLELEKDLIKDGHESFYKKVSAENLLNIRDYGRIRRDCMSDKSIEELESVKEGYDTFAQWNEFMDKMDTL